VLFVGFLCAFCVLAFLGRVVYAAEFVHSSIIETAFDDLVAEQRKHSATQKQRPRIPIPINTRRPALIVDRALRLRAQLTDFPKLQRVVSQKQDRG
jgi:hypothetical protein